MSGSSQRIRDFRPVDMHPIHAAILKNLPDEGTVVDLLKVGKTSNQLAHEINEKSSIKYEGITISGLMRTLELNGLVMGFRLPSSSKGLAFQITEKGKQYVKEYEKETGV